MNVKEIFEQYGGALIRLKHDAPRVIWRQGEWYLLSGYHTGRMNLVVSRDGGAPKNQFDADTVFLPSLPPDWGGHYAMPGIWNFDELGSPSRQEICCRCGRTYDSKKAHRKVCK